MFELFFAIFFSKTVPTISVQVRLLITCPPRSIFKFRDKKTFDQFET